MRHNFGTGSRRDFWLVANMTYDVTAEILPEGTGNVGCKMLTEEIPIGKLVSVISYDVPFLRHVTSKYYLFCKKIKATM